MDAGRGGGAERVGDGGRTGGAAEARRGAGLKPVARRGSVAKSADAGAHPVLRPTSAFLCPGGGSLQNSAGACALPRGDPCGEFESPLLDQQLDRHPKRPRSMEARTNQEEGTPETTPPCFVELKPCC